MKAIRILGRNIRDSFKSVIRNFSLSIASISCITITLLLVSITMILSYNVNKFTKDLENDLTVVAFVKRNATDETVENIKNSINEIENVSSIIFKSREQVKEEMQKENEVFDSIMSEWTEEENPLQDVFYVKVNEIKDISITADKIRKIDNIDTVKYGEGMVDQLVGIFDIVKKASIIIVISLIIVTAFLISNTIKLTIYSRKNEIEIMRLVGTSNLVIKLPFMFEGLFLGIIGSIIPIIATIYGYIIAYSKLGGKLFSNLITMVKPSEFLYIIALLLIAVGAFVGMFGSYRAVRKYLKI